MTIVTAQPLYRFIDEMRLDQLPPEVVEMAKICLTDLLATLAAGSQTELVTIVDQFCQQQFSAGADASQSIAMTTKRVLSPAGAALLDAMAIDSMDAHDGHSLTKGHVGCAVLATINAFITTSEKPISVEQMLCYLIAGYEIGTRCGVILHSTCSDYHSSGAWNAVTCAALTSHFLSLDQEQFEHALGIAEYHGPRSQLMRDVDHPTMVKDGSGWGAMAGVSAAYLAQLGFTGAPAITVCAEDMAEYWQDLGTKWHILDQYLKPYPVCRWAHPAIDAVIDLKQRHGISAEEIVSVTIDTFHQATRLSQQLPESSDQAQYGIVYPIAVALAYGEVTPQNLLEDALKDEKVMAMFERVQIQEDSALSEHFPAQRLCRANIRTQYKSYQSELFSPRGEGEKKLTEQERLMKYQTLTEPAWGQTLSEQLLDNIKGINQTEGISAQAFLASVPSKFVL